MERDEAGFDGQVDGGVLRIRLNRPERLNAVSDRVMDALADRLERHGADPDVRVVLLTGSERFFCAGADLDGREPAGADPSPSTVDAAARLVRTVRDLPVPVVAAVNGPALGVGVSLVLAADVAVAVETAFLQVVFTRVGLMPDGGATALLTAAAGRAVALRMSLLADRIPAAEAVGLGLIAASRPAEDFERAVDEIVETLVSGASSALERTKAAVNLASLGALDRAMETERTGQLALLASDDFQEGVAAFEQRRPAVFGPRPTGLPVR